MPNIERLQAPSGGICTDASPDYVPANQASALTNLLPGVDGKVFMRGRIVSDTNTNSITGTTVAPDAFWAFDDVALIKGDPGGGTKTFRVNVAAQTKADVTATLVEVPLNNRHARYGAAVYGAIVDAASPQLGKWDGAASAIVPQANAPFQFTDLQVYAQRLFVLGGSLPGTTTPIINSSRVLFWTDAAPAADLSLLASWVDDTSGLTNQLYYDGDDTPVALAGCGRFLAILGSRSINILTGSGSSSFAVRNLTRSLGCTNVDSVVEDEAGFFFQSDRGYAYCDGSSVTIVSDTKVSRELTQYSPYWVYAASFGKGYVAVYPASNPGACWLFHSATKTWSKFSMNIGSTVPTSVFRTNSYPILWQSGGLRRAEAMLTTGVAGSTGFDNDGSTTTVMQTNWTSRFAHLGSPGALATVRRILLDYQYFCDPLSTFDADGWRVRAYDSVGNLLADATAPAQQTESRRSRFVMDVNAEADAVRLVVTNAATNTAAPKTALEIYDAWIEYEPAQPRGSI